MVDGLGAGRRLEMSTPGSYEAPGDAGARDPTRETGSMPGSGLCRLSSKATAAVAQHAHSLLHEGSRRLRGALGRRWVSYGARDANGGPVAYVALLSMHLDTVAVMPRHQQPLLLFAQRTSPSSRVGCSLRTRSVSATGSCVERQRGDLCADDQWYSACRLIGSDARRVAPSGRPSNAAEQLTTRTAPSVPHGVQSAARGGAHA